MRQNKATKLGDTVGSVPAGTNGHRDLMCLVIRSMQFQQYDFQSINLMS